MAKKRKIIFFDFDGVIADSFELAFKINREVLPGIVTKKDFQNIFNGNVNDWAMDRLRPAEEIARMKKFFFTKYIPQIKKVKVFPGIKEIIAKLAEIYNLFVVSSSIKSSIRNFLSKNNILSYFNNIVGSDSLDLNKTERIKKILKKYGAEPKDCLFITDTLGDIKEAASLDIQSIGVAWGFQKKESLRKGKPLAIAQKPENLLVLASDYFKQN